MEIRIFSTGGTIDDIDVESATNKSRETHLPSAFKQAKISQDVSIKRKVLMKKDSREITDSDRELIANECKKCKETRILITHGTFTMAETATYLGQRISDKTIVLTGSMIPLTEPKNDAEFNLGGAFIAVQLLPAGVYVVFNGMVFHWHNIKKNIEEGHFKKLF